VENDCCCMDELLNKIGLVVLVFECCSLVDEFGRLLIENIGIVGDGILDKTLRLPTIWAVMVIKNGNQYYVIMKCRTRILTVDWGNDWCCNCLSGNHRINISGYRRRWLDRGYHWWLLIENIIALSNTILFLVGI